MGTAPSRVIYWRTQGYSQTILFQSIDAHKVTVLICLLFWSIDALKVAHKPACFGLLMLTRVLFWSGYCFDLLTHSRLLTNQPVSVYWCPQGYCFDLFTVLIYWRTQGYSQTSLFWTINAHKGTVLICLLFWSIDATKVAHKPACFRLLMLLTWQPFWSVLLFWSAQSYSQTSLF